MAMAEQADSCLDLLYCEESIENDEISDCCIGISVENGDKETGNSLILFEDFLWDDDELESLFAKEKETHPGFHGEILDGSLLTTRSEAVKWILKVKNHYGFSALTCVLAVNYFERFMSCTMFQRDKPWMGQVTAVACLSLAAKVEETYVPLLLDLQVEEAKFVFEAKTIKRMELIVLSSLQWRMHPVTPLSFIDHISRRFGFSKNIHWKFLRQCELLLLSIIADHRICCFRPSVVAAVTIMQVIREFQWNQVEYHELLTILRINEDEVNDCFSLVNDGLTDCNLQSLKRKKPYPCSPNGVIDSLYSSDSSNDSWTSLPLFKKSRSQDQQMRIPSLNRMFVDVLDSPN